MRHLPFESCRGFLLALVLVSAAPAARADVERYSAASDSLPDSLACRPWTHVATGGTATLTGGVLTLSTNTDLDMQYYVLTEPAIALPPDSTVLEFRMRLVSGSAVLTTYAPVLVSVTRASSGSGFFFGIDVDVVYFKMAPDARSSSASLDTDGAMHTYRLVDNGTQVQLYYDGTPSIIGPHYTDEGDFGTDVRVIWGEVSGGAHGTLEWEYFEHNASTGVCIATPVAPATWGSIKALFR